LIALAREKGASAIADEMLPKLLGATSMRERPDVQTRVRSIAESNTGDALAGALTAMKVRPDASNMLEHISCATLVVGGNEDLVTPHAEVERMQLRIPRSHFVVLHGAGHLSNIEAPEDFSLALTDFLTSRM
jgi:pimeloyl-ACP methyl ester carboxylesterase